MRAALALGAPAMLAGCAIGPPDAPVPAAATSLPEAYGEAAAAPRAYRSVKWWQSYEDPALDGLVERALRRNLDIAEAVARIEEVEARYALERAGRFPQVNAGAEANYANQPATGLGAALGELGQGEPGEDGSADPPADGTDGGTPPPESDPRRFSFSTYTAQLEASWEADIWGRLRNRARAADANYRASRAELQAVRIRIASEVMRNYFDLVETEQLRELSERQAAILTERVGLAERAFLRGIGSSFELITLRESRREAEANVPLLEANLARSKARLGVLLGSYPREVDAYLAEAGRLAVTLPMEAVPAGLPARLLAGRPDIVAARAQLDAARFGVAAAEAARLPQLTLSASGGLEGNEPSGAFEPQNWFVNLLGALTAPIFDAGRIGAQIDISEAQMRQRALAYGRTVLDAVAEVEAALARHAAAAQRVRLIEADLASARDAADLQLRRFERGTGNYSDWLDARLNVLNSRRLMVEAERAVAEARLGVHRALGGAWKREWLARADRDG
ncbi:efflux transporter outer membrane subunit [Erythrobacter sp. HL-111]|uniref:efflux transporter outer membrane subunit n=1 Tax=Erythrobacter sp. HL-111 TaxID=1798193 RepID=UPI0006DA931E|nr:TolC family protein [Erythrobacter sp. HL-111]KPP91219.1 MAG: efflux pump outer membrane secretin [Erythrobacteraceae bacterium HL-111]SDT06255.1 efflux transporter, outer membrane factor (OMF) lipoprotein, NodT family [Erythrobacter sp. HL-111]